MKLKHFNQTILGRLFRLQFSSIKTAIETDTDSDSTKIV